MAFDIMFARTCPIFISSCSISSGISSSLSDP